MKKYIQNIILSGILGAFVSSTVVGAQEQSLMDGTSAEIKYKYLSNENVDPYRQYAREKPSGDYLVAAKKVRDVRQCLVKSEKTRSTPDIRLIDWHFPNGWPEVSVCLFRIFSSISSVEGSVKWLEYHGFEVSIDNTGTDGLVGVSAIFRPKEGNTLTNQGFFTTCCMG